MIYRFLADAVLLLHLGFILFVVFGALLVARRPRLLPLHLAAAAWGFAIEVLGAICPLTHVENRMRLLAGDAGYSGGFIDHYLLPLVYPGAMTRSLQIALAAGVLLINAGLYVWIVRRRRVAGTAGQPMAHSTQAKPSRASSAKASAGPQEPAA
ncbi:DUF2784 domain-containing protein [Massilia sp. LjRoot122]|uniref:DUF2784 domain-containing protein n=1 Tax=Massilia sp. LjRoot122 TaxID=3342257 RepID=UPI003F503A3D